MGWKRIQIQLIPTLSLWALPFFFPFMFVVELKTKAVKIKNFKCFVNSNYFEDKSKRNPCFNSCNIFCFNSYAEKKKKTFFPLKNLLTVMIILRKQFYCLLLLRIQTKILNNLWNSCFRFTLLLLPCLVGHIYIKTVKSIILLVTTTEVGLGTFYYYFCYIWYSIDIVYTFYIYIIYISLHCHFRGHILFNISWGQISLFLVRGTDENTKQN